MKEYSVSRLVKTEDLNHHGTLFAGRLAEWFVEAGFIAAATLTKSPDSIVCLNIHGLVFKSPIDKASIITIKTRVALLGQTRIVVYGKIQSENKVIFPIEGFLTFIYVDEEGKKRPHGLNLDEAINQEEVLIRERACIL